MAIARIALLVTLLVACEEKPAGRKLASGIASRILVHDGHVAFLLDAVHPDDRSVPDDLAAGDLWLDDRKAGSSVSSQPGMFAFRGLVKPVKTIADFADILAGHPLLPSAWVQKLCYYVDSAPCAEEDPEYRRIVGSYLSSDYGIRSMPSCATVATCWPSRLKILPVASPRAPWALRPESTLSESFSRYEKRL